MFNSAWGMGGPFYTIVPVSGRSRTNVPYQYQITWRKKGTAVMRGNTWLKLLLDVRTDQCTSSGNRKKTKSQLWGEKLCWNSSLIYVPMYLSGNITNKNKKTAVSWKISAETIFLPVGYIPVCLIRSIGYECPVSGMVPCSIMFPYEATFIPMSPYQVPHVPLCLVRATAVQYRTLVSL